GPQPLRVGACFVSTLDQNDPQYQGRAHYEDFQLRLRHGDAVQIDMDAIPGAAAGNDPAEFGFDTYLEVRRAGQDLPWMVNDDRPGSLNSRLVFVAPIDEVYVIRARAYGSGLGDY